MDFQQKLAQLARVHDWSDPLVAHALSFYQNAGATEGEILDALHEAANALCISEIRGFDPALANVGAKALGFRSISELVAFRHKHPMLSESWHAMPATAPCRGEVVALSQTEAVIDIGDHCYRFTGWHDVALTIGDTIAVRAMNEVRKIICHTHSIRSLSC